MQALIGRVTSSVWTPRAATITIGVTFFVLRVAAGPRAYIDALTELAQMPPHNTVTGLTQRRVPSLVLLAGEATGGGTGGWFGNQRSNATNKLRCLIGGTLMAVGGRLIPVATTGYCVWACHFVCRMPVGANHGALEHRGVADYGAKTGH